MSAIISNKFRVLNAENFVSYASSTPSKLYSFIGQPNATNPEVGIGISNWDFGPAPLDDFEQENRIKEVILALRKITSNDIRRVVRKVQWQSGQVYEMYRHDYNIYNLSPVTNSSTLYDVNYYVVNDNYRVYICLNNGADPDNPLGRPSIDQPDFTSIPEPGPAGTSGDGYIWKYLFTIKPADILKFDNDFYIPLPNNWGETIGDESYLNKTEAVDGKIETVIIRSKGTGYPANGDYVNIPILGDGKDGKVTIKTNSFGEVSAVQVTNGGSGYTRGTIKFQPGFPGVPEGISGNSSNYASFDVIIPPKGGHGYDIYNELGAYRVLIYSRFETEEENPDVVVGNDFATIGLIDGPEITGDLTYASALNGLKLTGGNVNYSVDEKITQTIGTGKTAVGFVASWDNTTKILRYYQSVGAATTSVGYNLYNFTSSPEAGGSLSIVGSSGNTLGIDTSFGGSTITINNVIYQLGSNFVSGISSSEYKSGTGDIIYIDNRQPILRSLRQKEDIKIILEF